MKHSIKPIKIANVIELSPVGIISVVAATLSMVTVALGAEVYTYHKEVEIENSGSVAPVAGQGDIASRRNEGLSNRYRQPRLVKAL